MVKFRNLRLKYSIDLALEKYASAENENEFVASSPLENQDVGPFAEATRLHEKKQKEGLVPKWREACDDWVTRRLIDSPGKNTAVSELYNAYIEENPKDYLDIGQFGKVLRSRCPRGKRRRGRQGAQVYVYRDVSLTSRGDFPSKSETTTTLKTSSMSSSLPEQSAISTGCQNSVTTVLNVDENALSVVIENQKTEPVLVSVPESGSKFPTEVLSQSGTSASHSKGQQDSGNVKAHCSSQVLKKRKSEDQKEYVMRPKVKRAKIVSHDGKPIFHPKNCEMHSIKNFNNNFEKDADISNSTDVVNSTRFHQKETDEVRIKSVNDSDDKSNNDSKINPDVVITDEEENCHAVKTNYPSGPLPPVPQQHPELRAKSDLDVINDEQKFSGNASANRMKIARNWIDKNLQDCVGAFTHAATIQAAYTHDHPDEPLSEKSMAVVIRGKYPTRRKAYVDQEGKSYYIYQNLQLAVDVKLPNKDSQGKVSSELPVQDHRRPSLVTNGDKLVAVVNPPSSAIFEYEGVQCVAVQLSVTDSSNHCRKNIHSDKVKFVNNYLGPNMIDMVGNRIKTSGSSQLGELGFASKAQVRPYAPNSLQIQSTNQEYNSGSSFQTSQTSGTPSPGPQGNLVRNCEIENCEATPCVKNSSNTSSDFIREDPGTEITSASVVEEIQNIILPPDTSILETSSKKADIHMSVSDYIKGEMSDKSMLMTKTLETEKYDCIHFRNVEDGNGIEPTTARETQTDSRRVSGTGIIPANSDHQIYTVDSKTSIGKSSLNDLPNVSSKLQNASRSVGAVEAAKILIIDDLYDKQDLSSAVEKITKYSDSIILSTRLDGHTNNAVQKGVKRKSKDARKGDVKSTCKFSAANKSDCWDADIRKHLYTDNPFIKSSDSKIKEDEHVTKSKNTAIQGDSDFNSLKKYKVQVKRQTKDHRKLKKAKLKVGLPQIDSKINKEKFNSGEEASQNKNTLASKNILKPNISNVESPDVNPKSLDNIAIDFSVNANKQYRLKYEEGHDDKFTSEFYSYPYTFSENTQRKKEEMQGSLATYDKQALNMFKG